MIIPCGVALELIQKDVFGLRRLSQVSASFHSSSLWNFWIQIILIILLFCTRCQVFFTRLEILRLDLILRRLLVIIRNGYLKLELVWVHRWFLVLPFIAFVFWLIYLHTRFLILCIRIGWNGLLFLLIKILLRSRRFQAFWIDFLILRYNLFQSWLNAFLISSLLRAWRRSSSS